MAADGTVVRYGAGPALVLSFLLLGAVCALAGLCYAELTALIPISGSAYTYAYATLGELVAWIIGWDLILEYAIGNMAVAIAWSGYFTSLLRFFGIDFPFWLSHSYRDVLLSFPERMGELPLVFGHAISINLPGIAIVALITWVLVIGIRESASVNNAMVVLKLAVLALFVGVGLFYVDPRNWTPFAPNGWRGIHQGAAIVFFAYIGFDAISTAAEETKDPQRNMPRGILGSLAICTLIYVIVGAGRHRARAVPAAQGRGPAGARVRGRRHRLGPGDHRLRRGRVDDRGAAGVPARPAAHLLLDEPRRPAAARLPQGARALRHAARHDDRDRDRGGARLDDPRRRRDLRPHQHRDAVRVLRGLPGRARAADQGSESPAAVPRAARVAGGPARSGRCAWS